MKTLVLYASPLTEMETGSISQKATKRYLEFYKKEYPESEIVEVDLNKLDHLHTSLTSYSMASGSFFDNGVTDKLLEELDRFEHVIVATSMINFNVPAILKNLIDHIAVAGRTFRYKYDGNGESEGLLTNISIKIIATQGAPKGWYPFGDHVKYLEGTFDFLGMKVNKSILIDGTKTKEFNSVPLEEHLNSLEETFKNQTKFK